jgi:hypothetical protein
MLDFLCIAVSRLVINRNNGYHAFFEQKGLLFFQDAAFFRLGCVCDGRVGVSPGM